MIETFQVRTAPNGTATAIPCTSSYSLRDWMREALARVSKKSELAKAIGYVLTRWRALTRYCDEGGIEIDNNTAERSLRTVALGRKNYFFCGIGRRRRTRRGNLQPDRHGQAQRNSGGQISLGEIEPIPCAAIANDEHNCLAMLKRRQGESLRDLLARLDAAIAIVWNEERFIDEINTLIPVSRRP